MKKYEMVVKQHLILIIHGIYKVEIELSNGKTFVSLYHINEVNYDVVKYMSVNSISAEELGFTIARGGYDAIPGVGGLGVARWSGHGPLYGSFEISLDKLNIFNLKPEDMKVVFCLSADGNAWAAGSVYVYYSEDDYDLYVVDAVSWTAVEQYFDRSVNITFRDEPIQKIKFLIDGYDRRISRNKSIYKEYYTKS